MNIKQIKLNKNEKKKNVHKANNSNIAVLEVKR